MAWLIAHDITPGWTAMDPPAVTASAAWLEHGDESQYTISDEFGPVGSVWTRYFVDVQSAQREDLIWIERLPLDIAPLRVAANSAFTADGALDEFTIRLETAAADVNLHGERFPADFSFRLESGPIDKTFKLPLTQGGLFSGAFLPFSDMSDLQVGTRWRMQVVNPVALLTGVGQQFLPVLVEVTGEERIPTADGEHNCLVVESPSVKAWVGAGGLVLRQEVTIAGLGRFRIERRAEFDEKERMRVRQIVLGEKRGRRR